MAKTSGTLGGRIKQMLKERGMTQAELARRVGTKQQTISYIVSEDAPATTSRYATKIAAILGVNPAWLTTGEGNPGDQTVAVQVEGVTVRAAQLPILHADQVVPYLSKKLNHFNGQLMTDRASADHAFALEIDGDSMAPAFRPGDRVVIDTKIKPEPGDYVAALLDDAVVTFRRYRARHPGFELIPENEDWETVGSGDSVRILGVMTEHRSYRKQRS
jgi:SOS-response transcriptional repressor LexA